MRPLIALTIFFAIVAPASAMTCPQDGHCGRLTVPLDHSGAVPGTLTLPYAVLPATGPKEGTVVLLSGGPGEPGAAFAAPLETRLAAIRKANDLVFVDQRGTGGADNVDCAGADFDLTPGETLACAQLLGPDRRRFWSTAETARDIDDLRVALGADRITVLGISYGTKVAGEYARRFPDHTAAVILDSPVGLSGIDDLRLGAAAALPRVLRDDCTAVCASTVRHPETVLQRALKRRGSRFSEQQIYDMASTLDSDLVMQSSLPAALESLADGDGAPLAHLRQLQLEPAPRGGTPKPPPLDERDSESRYLATWCRESNAPWSPASDPATRRATADAFVAAHPHAWAPFDAKIAWNFADDVCRAWPAEPAPEPVPDTMVTAPALVISGRSDVRTPLESAKAIAATYPHHTLLAVAGEGHSVLADSRCAVDDVAAFLAGATVKPCDESKYPYVAVEPYLPPSGLSARHAAQAAVDGAFHDLYASYYYLGFHERMRMPGLRSGVVQTSKDHVLHFHRDVWTSGVAVTGVLNDNGNGHLTLSGRAHGIVSVRRYKLE